MDALRKHGRLAHVSPQVHDDPIRIWFVGHFAFLTSLCPTMAITQTTWLSFDAQWLMEEQNDIDVWEIPEQWLKEMKTPISWFQVSQQLDGVSHVVRYCVDVLTGNLRTLISWGREQCGAIEVKTGCSTGFAYHPAECLQRRTVSGECIIKLPKKIFSKWWVQPFSGSIPVRFVDGGIFTQMGMEMQAAAQESFHSDHTLPYLLASRWRSRQQFHLGRILPAICFWFWQYLVLAKIGILDTCASRMLLSRFRCLKRSH